MEKMMTTHRYRLPYGLPLVAALLCAGQSGSQAQELPDATVPVGEEKDQAIAISGLAFFDYSLELGEDDDNANAFEMSRLYINFKADLGDGWHARATPDISKREAPPDDFLQARLKYAYVQKDDVFAGSRLTLGLGSTPWVGYVDKLFGQRFITKSLTDRKFGAATVLNSADLGAMLDGKLDDGSIAYAIGIYNGEGYSHGESDIVKSAQARVTLKPFAPADSEYLNGLEVSVFGALPIGSRGEETDGSRLGGLIGYVGRDSALFATFMRARDGDPIVSSEGIGVYGRVSYAGWDLLARIYLIDPDLATSEDRKKQTLVGLGRKLQKKVRFAMSYERKAEDKKQTDYTLAAHLEFKF